MRRKLTEKMERPGVRFKRFRNMTRGAQLCVVVLVLIALAAVFAPLISPHDPQAIEVARQAPNGDFLFGTDEKGRDILSRMIYGARYSLVIGFAATAFALFFGAIFGALAAVSRKW
ncbi:ABC transporter, partial [Actinotignum timonense]|nr:ABC transporter [Actinotignum timonense]